MNDKLANAAGRLNKDGCTLCLLKDGREYLSREKGIKTLLSLYDDEAWRGAVAADTIVGKAAAMLYTLMGAEAVYAGVLSEAGRAIFERYGIPYAYAALTDSIINRRGDGLCPMELAVRELADPADAPDALRRKLAQLRR